MSFEDTGQRLEAEIGLYFYNARFYDATLGRFAQADTIIPGAGNVLALDRYAYTLNNPLRYTDPSGNFPWFAAIGFVIFMSQIPSSQRQTNPDNWGSPEVQLLGISLMCPLFDVAATSIECLAYGCDPVMASMAMLPGPSPTVVDNVLDDVIDGVDGSIDDIVDEFIHGPASASTTVLGRGQGSPMYMNWVSKAQDLEARYLWVEPDIWDALDDPWEQVNKPFLDNGIARGDKFWVEYNVDDLMKDILNDKIVSMLHREVKYLLDKGYVWDGNELVPSK